MNQNYQQTPSLVMVTYNALEWTKITFESVIKNTQTPYHFVIVDNGSAQDTLDYLDALEKQPISGKMISLKIVRLGKNLRYGPAICRGGEVNNSKLTIVLNNDIVVPPFSRNGEDWLETLIAIKNENPNLAILGTGRPSYDTKHPSGVVSKDFQKSLPKGLEPEAELEAYFQGNFETYLINSYKVNPDRLILFKPFQQVVTCLAMFDLEIMNSLGGLADERLLSCEDSDASIRAALGINTKGEKIAEGYLFGITNDVIIYHGKHKSYTDPKGVADRRLIDLSTATYLQTIWDKEIRKFIMQQIDQGVDVQARLNDTHDSRWWLIRMQNLNSPFFADGKLLPETVTNSGIPIFSLPHSTCQELYDYVKDNMPLFERPIDYNESYRYGGSPVNK